MQCDKIQDNILSPDNAVKILSDGLSFCAIMYITVHELQTVKNGPVFTHSVAFSCSPEKMFVL